MNNDNPTPSCPNPNQPKNHNLWEDKQTKQRPIERKKKDGEGGGEEDEDEKENKKKKER